ncbi:cell envelope integrity protein TolA [Novosphingobium fuchskuhlense]|uniref:cell envelope integrity protein TolA n=1 Tax=Novosphingobium fuchskuhlense TaxID=1117702 RepID=UPI0009E95CF8|nr:cell envelope integrity protein TolA [Novosphingobium fuchskuhlense]
MSATSSPPGLTRDEAPLPFGALIIALAAHAGLIAALTLAPPGRTIMSPPERMTVTFADETADTSTSPDPNEAAAADVAPVIGEPAPEPVAAEPVPQMAPPQPLPKPAPAQQPQAKPAPQPRPAPKAAPLPPPRAAPAAPPKPAARPAAASPPADPRQRRRSDAPGGASQLGPDFLKGINTGTRPGATGNPADAASEQVKAAIRVTINRKVLPPWNSCPVNGVEIEKLRASVTFQLDRGGNITSIAPPVLSGQTPANTPQVSRFTECAVRAIRTAAPFNLPPESYEFWKTYKLNFRKE